MNERLDLRFLKRFAENIERTCAEEDAQGERPRRVGEGQLKEIRHPRAENNADQIAARVEPSGNALQGSQIRSRSAGTSSQTRSRRKSRGIFKLLPEQRVDAAGGLNADFHGLAANRLNSLGMLVFGVFLFGALVWFGLARMSTAAIAPGVVTVDGASKTIQHLNGGIVESVHVAEGDFVEQGQLLIKLEDTINLAGLVSITEELVQRRINLARLKAIVDERDEIVAPEFDFRVDENLLKEKLAEQSRLFQTGLQRFRALSSLGLKEGSYLQEEVAALEAEERSRREQLLVLTEELARRQSLFAAGMVKRDYVYQIEQRASDLKAQQDAHRAVLAARRASLDNAVHKVQDLRLKRIQDAATEYEVEQAVAGRLERQIADVRDRVIRTRIVAPVSGRVLNLRANTIGGVLQAGGPVMEIVPHSAALVIDARLQPKDRDVVSAGLPAQVRLSAFNARHSRPIPGTVRYVSADSVAVNNSSEGASSRVAGSAPHYIARVEFDSASLENNDVELHPGMQAEVTIVTGKRTMLDYLFSPLAGSIGRAFTED